MCSSDLGSNNEAALIIIDEKFLQVCEIQTIKAVGVVSSVPALVGAYVTNNTLIVEVESDRIIDKKTEVVVRLSGVRKGRLGKRFATHTYEEMELNNRFWSRWREG